MILSCAIVKAMNPGDVFDLKHKKFPEWEFRLTCDSDGYSLFVREPHKFRCAYRAVPWGNLLFGVASILKQDYTLKLPYEFLTVVMEGKNYLITG